MKQWDMVWNNTARLYNTRTMGIPLFSWGLTALMAIGYWASLYGQVIVRTPALSPDGNTLAFSYDGDIWSVSSEGGTAQRRTVHEAYESSPQWSPDGTRIVFESNRFKHPDIFILSMEEPGIKRLTFHSNGSRHPSWGQGGILFESTRVRQEIEWEKEIYEVLPEGGTPVRKMDAFGYTPKYSPSGRYIAFERGPCRVAREQYRGSANKDIWIYDTALHHFIQLTTDEGQDILPDWGNSDDTLYFLSARTGRYNLYRMELKDGNPAASPIPLTKLDTMGIRYMDIAGNGQRGVVAVGPELYTLDLEAPFVLRKIHITLTGDYHGYPVQQLKMTHDIEQYAVSPNEKLLAVVLHGQLALKLMNKEYKKVRVVSSSGARARIPQWLNDSTCLFLSDKSGHYALYTLAKKRGERNNLYHALEIETRLRLDVGEDIMDMAISPDRKKIALRIGRGKLLVYSISSTEELSHPIELVKGWAIPSDLAWSPDSRWIAYARNDLSFNRDIFITKADGSTTPINVSMHPRRDRSPKWSPDGKKLYFLSDRHKRDYDIWLVWLTKQEGWKSKEERQIEDEVAQLTKRKDSILSKVRVDAERIFDRQVQITNLTGDEGNLIVGKNSQKIYFTSASAPLEGKKQKRAWIEMRWDGQKAKTLKDAFEGSELRLSKDAKNVFLLDKKRGFGVMDIAKKKASPHPFAASIRIDHHRERAQIFDEAWRMLKAGFYDPEWIEKNAMKLEKTYRPWALAATTQEDFSYIFNLMLGQLNTSHMGLYSKSNVKLQEEKTGLLGIETKPVLQGLEVTYVLYRSPAQRPTSTLRVGDIITSIDHHPITSNDNINALLLGMQGQRTAIDILRDGKPTQIILLPATSLRQVRYEAWVKRMQEMTDSLSHGRLGYIHIQGMNWTSFERFQRELMASGYGKEGIVIDVRNNGGGWTTDMLMAILHVEQHAYTVPRGATPSLRLHDQFRSSYPYSERLIFPPLMKPSVALCNESSYSNAEIFSHAYKNLGIGTLVGVPTFGAVISTGAYRLVDGSTVRMPFRAWYAKQTGLNMEGYPAIPDIVVHNPPDSKWRKGDRQLEMAIGTLLQQIDHIDSNK